MKGEMIGLRKGMENPGECEGWMGGTDRHGVGTEVKVIRVLQQ